MPQFKVAKTNNELKILNNKLIEDKLYIYKESNKIGQMYYDFGYDENNNPIRIKIGSSNDIYVSLVTLQHDTETVNVGQINLCDTSKTLNIDEISINSFVISDTFIYVIRTINRTNGLLTLKKIYNQHDLTWNDYY